MPASPALVRALTEAQRLGFLGERDLDEVIAHARGFVTALDDLTGIARGRIVDLGAGGGVPGLVIADERPAWALTLVDRRAKRTDFLQRMVTRLGWTDRVEVRCADVDDLIRESPHHFVAAVARGFGPPERTLTVAEQLTVPRGRIVVSEPPGGDRWDPALLDRLGLQYRDLSLDAGRFAVFERFT